MTVDRLNKEQGLEVEKIAPSCSFALSSEICDVTERVSSGRMQSLDKILLSSTPV